MTRLAAVLAAALLASGCIISDDEADLGSVYLYWDFLRYAPDNAQAASDGFIVYDAGMVGTPYTACAESGVEAVDITTPNGTLSYDCVTAGQDGGVQGIILDALPAGIVQIRVQGWRRDFGVDRVLWDSTQEVQVRGGGDVRYDFHVDPVAADLDMVAYFTNRMADPDLTYETCNAALNPEVDYWMYDSSGSIVYDATVLCPSGASALGLPVVHDLVDLDTYTLRMQGFIGGEGAPSYDSCQATDARYLEHRHYAAYVNPNPVEVDLYTDPYCPAGP